MPSELSATLEISVQPELRTASDALPWLWVLDWLRVPVGDDQSATGDSKPKSTRRNLMLKWIDCGLSSLSQPSPLELECLNAHQRRLALVDDVHDHGLRSRGIRLLRQ